MEMFTQMLQCFFIPVLLLSELHQQTLQMSCGVLLRQDTDLMGQL